MTLLAIFGCSPSIRELPATLEELSIDATIEQSTEKCGTSGEGYTSEHISVALENKEGRTLEREDLRIELNDVPLTMRIGHGNFYDRHPFYRLDDGAAHIAPDEACRFTLVWPDGTHHVAGIVRSPKPLALAQFGFPATASRAEPLAIGWTGLTEPVELVVFRNHAYTDMAGNTVVEDGSLNDPGALRRTVGPGLFRRASGRMEIPRSYLADDDGRRVSSIGVAISVTHEGVVQGPFSPKSTLRATRRLIFRAELTD